MQRIRDVLFTIIIGCSLLSVVSYAAASYMSPKLQHNAKSELEGRIYQGFPDLSLSSIRSGRFQGDFSRYVADSIPERNRAIIANALVQRAAIELANTAFGFDTYPTYYGSEYLYTPATEHITEAPWLIRDHSLESLSKATRAYSSFAKEHPDINWAFCMPDRAITATSSPAHALVNNPADSTYLHGAFFSRLPANCIPVDTTYRDSSAWGNAFQKTDHHWTIQGAYDQYRNTVYALGQKPLGQARLYKVNTGIFWGANSRSGLCFLGSGDVLEDYSLELDGIQVIVDDKQQEPTYLDKGILDPNTRITKTSKYTNLYAAWFHGDPGIIKIRNDKAQSDRALLIIGDSNSNCCERFYAQNYKVTYIIDPRHYKKSLSAFMKENHVDDGLFLMSANNMFSATLINALSS